MPQIIVMADGPTDNGAAPVMFRERVSAQDFESGHFSAQLVERIGWAVGDAAEVEREQGADDGEQNAFDREPESLPEPASLPGAAVRAAAPQAW